MNRKSLGVVSLAIALVLSSVTIRQAHADLTREQREVLAQDYVSLLYDLDRLERSLYFKNAEITQWEYSINAMEASRSGLTILLVYTYESLTPDEVYSIHAQLDVLYDQIPHAQLELDLYKSTRDSLEAEMSSVQAAMTLIASFLAGY